MRGWDEMNSCIDCIYFDLGNEEPCNSCNPRFEHPNFEPKEKVEEVDKTYTTGQMIDMLLENTKRKAYTEDRGSIENTVIVSKNEILVWEHNKNQYLPKPFYKDRRWTIIEPEPEQVDYNEEIEQLRKENEQLKQECERYKYFASKCGYFR